MGLGNVLIMGDSYSTYEGRIPQGYPAHYRDEGGENKDVRNVSQMWWYQVLEKANGNLILNSSYSGSTICHTGYFGADSSHTSFVGRFDELVDQGFFDQNCIDTVFVFGGTNDSWAEVPIGTVKWAEWKKEDLYSFAPASCYLLHRIRLILPDATVCCILNTGLRKPVEDILVTVCCHTGAKIIKLHDINKDGGHPNAKGMDEISRQILCYLTEKKG